MIAAVDLTDLWSALPLALVAGTHAATWGAYKDAPYEGYHPTRQLRTVVAATLAAVLGVMTGLVDPHTVVPAIGVVYSLERLATEWWKTIVRVDDQSAYAIPMRLGFRGRPIDLDSVRYSVGALALVAVVALGAAVHSAQSSLGWLPWWVVVLGVGGLGGWATAVGGAWKDAPIEGFSGWKFLRSPAIATAWAVPLSLMTESWVTLCLAAGGLAVFSIETYKTFWTGDRAPGKFAHRPQPDLPPAIRRVTGLLHAGAWVMFAAVGLQAGSSIWKGPRGASDLPFDLASTLVAAGALLVAGSVLRASERRARLFVVSNAALAAKSAEVPASMSGVAHTSASVGGLR